MHPKKVRWSNEVSYRTIRLDPADHGVTTLWLDRPDSLNALSAEMLDELRSAVEGIGASGARCLLITGAGRGFSSGAELAGSALPDDAGLELERRFNPLIEAIAALDIPVVAAVNGPAAGAGASLALSADIVIAARSAFFVQAFVNIGLIPDAGASWLLPRLVGRARALEMMMLGDRISADQALDWGLIARVTEDSELMREAATLAARLAAGPTRALALIRRLVQEGGSRTLSEALAAEREAQRLAGRTRDFAEGVMAFVQKRPAAFRGH